MLTAPLGRSVKSTVPQQELGCPKETVFFTCTGPSSSYTQLRISTGSGRRGPKSSMHVSHEHMQSSRRSAQYFFLCCALWDRTWHAHGPSIWFISPPQYFTLQQLPDCRWGLNWQALLPQWGWAIRQCLKCRHHPYLHKRWGNNLKIHAHHFYRSHLPRSISHENDMRLILPVFKGEPWFLGQRPLLSARAAFPHHTPGSTGSRSFGSP